MNEIISVDSRSTNCEAKGLQSIVLLLYVENHGRTATKAPITNRCSETAVRGDTHNSKDEDCVKLIRLELIIYNVTMEKVEVYLSA